MNHAHTMLPMSRVRRDHGFTMVELLIAITLAVFLCGGALTIVARTKSTFVAQNQLAQLQDNIRLSMTFMAEIIESGGYYPNPASNTAAAAMPAITAPATFAAGQPFLGTYSATGAGDTVTVRFGAGNGDNIFGCTGATNTTVSPLDTYINQFWVQTAVSVGQQPQLMCTFTHGTTTAPAIPLITGVSKLAVLYGVKRNSTDTGTCTDTYLNASQMLAADWTAVCAVKVTVTYINPLNAAAPITITRVIAVMNAAGVNS